MVPAVAIKRTKTVSIILLAAATILAALWLGPRRSSPRVINIGTNDLPVSMRDPCAVDVSGRLTSTHVLVGEREEHLAITLRAPACGERTQRPPMSIAIVIDRSGSMTGQPIAEARRAARRLVDLLEPRDAFSIVTYSTGAELVAPMMAATEDAKAAARRAIDGIVDDGGTNISAGLELGHAQVKMSPVLDGLRRIVLISDGEANEGIYDRPGLTRIAADTASAGASISTVGVGLDYDEVTMTSIAAAGRGNYYFIEESTQLADMFAAELGSAGKTVASDAELTLVAAPGIEILEVYGGGRAGDNGTWSVPVADLTAGETRKIVARVRVRAEAKGTIELATAHLVYRPVDAHQRREVSTVARAEVTGDAKVVRAGVDVTTVRLVEEAETARALEQANMAYDKGGYEDAKQILDGRVQTLRARAADYGDDGIAEGSLKAANEAMDNYAAAPAATGAGGSKAKKAASKAAFDLAK